MQAETPDAHQEVDLFDVMAARIRAGEPIHIQVPFPEVLGRTILAQIERLKRETGKPVHVIFS
ncbi:hypothetical protein [Piscinibacter gummiphilus]|uniref:Uncharacterized protein n=1 Tax=Piscinibacter gummiphilus TaxID=946333 RepID=A0ABZ0D868_9BURK|nr:hypothetical protein [Piscinibacter gummiphilus]WOB11218.1 hypothetical protein RXV79_26670 [Piscinibacter gummiphilus]